MKVITRFDIKDVKRTIDEYLFMEKYEKYGPYKQQPRTKAVIAFYQLGQGLRWKGSESEWESYAACILHLYGMLVHFDLLPFDFDIKNVPYGRIDPSLLLMWFTELQQHAHYGELFLRFPRGKRFNPEVLRERVNMITKMLIGKIPVDIRNRAFTLAKEEMLGL